MIQSMTGYGNAVVAYKDKKIHVTPCLAPCDANKNQKKHIFSIKP